MRLWKRPPPETAKIGNCVIFSEQGTTHAIITFSSLWFSIVRHHFISHYFTKAQILLIFIVSSWLTVITSARDDCFFSSPWFVGELVCSSGIYSKSNGWIFGNGAVCDEKQ